MTFPRLTRAEQAALDRAARRLIPDNDIAFEFIGGRARGDNTSRWAIVWLPLAGLGVRVAGAVEPVQQAGQIDDGCD